MDRNARHQNPTRDGPLGSPGVTDPSDHSSDHPEPGIPRGLTLESYQPNGIACNPKTDRTRYCTRATSLIAVHRTLPSAAILLVRCKTWSCPYCSRRNLAILRGRATAGLPTKLLTLTTRPLKHETPKACHDRCRPRITRLLGWLRKKYGAIEAMTILERTKRGFPHWHLLVRANYLPQGEISSRWERLTGARVVDIRRIKSDREAVIYVTKYVTKAVRHPPALRLGRIVSFTKKYSPKPVRPAWCDQYHFLLVPRSPLELLPFLSPDWTCDFDGQAWHLRIPVPCPISGVSLLFTTAYKCTRAPPAFWS